MIGSLLQISQLRPKDYLHHPFDGFTQRLSSHICADVFRIWHRSKFCSIHLRETIRRFGAQEREFKRSKPRSQKLITGALILQMTFVIYEELIEYRLRRKRCSNLNCFRNIALIYEINKSYGFHFTIQPFPI